MLAQHKKISNREVSESFAKNQSKDIFNDNLDKDVKTAIKSIVEEFKKLYIEKHLRENHWNIAKTADSIAISRSGLHNKIKEYRIIKKIS